MEDFIMNIVFTIVGVGMSIGVFAILFIFQDGLILAEALKKLNFAPQMGVVLAPYIVMSSGEFGEPYSAKTWGITIAIMAGCLLLSMFIMFFVNWLEERAKRRQNKRQIKQNVEKNFGEMFKDIGFSNVNGTCKKDKGERVVAQTKQKKSIKFIFASLLAQAWGATLVAAVFVPVFVALDEGVEEILKPLCILTVVLGVGLSFACKWGFKKISANF